MEKIKDCPISRLLNQEHYSFTTEVDNVISHYPAEALGFSSEYQLFRGFLSDEGEALNYVRKSSYSELVDSAVAKCGKTILGMEDFVSSCRNHYNPEIKEAAARIELLWIANKDVKSNARKKKEGAIKKLLAELNGTYKPDVVLMQMEGWVNELGANHDDYLTLENGRYDDKKSKTELRMEEVRIQIDAAYRAITTKVNALIIVNGPDQYQAFVDDMNQRIDTYANIVALRKGNQKKETVEEKVEGTK